MAGKDYSVIARTLIEALPYIKRFHGEIVVVKFGGSLLDDTQARDSFANDLVLLKYCGMKPVVVHGGGDEISKWSERLGKKPKFIDGMRVTDDETLEIAEMVLSGKLTSEIVSLLNHTGGRAIGLSGKDANMLIARQSHSKKDGDLGHFGEIESIDVSLIRTLIEQGYIPVISSIGSSRDGRSLNLRSDAVASSLAAALKAQKLVFLSNLPGIAKEGTTLSFLDLPGAQALVDDTAISRGMQDKVRDSIRALRGGVTSVHILDGRAEHPLLIEVFTDGGIGTMISNERVRL